MVDEDLLAMAQSMLHEGRLARAWLALDPEHAIVGYKVGAGALLLELGGAEQPVACTPMGSGYVVQPSVDVAETERAEADCARQWSVLRRLLREKAVQM